MPLWGNTANSSGLGAPKWNSWAESNALGVNLYANTTEGAFSNNAVVGVYGADIANTQALAAISAPGWVQAVHLTGYIASLALSNNGLTFANGESVLLSGGSLNATANAITNSSGGLVGFTMGNIGSGYTNAASVTSAFQRQKHLNNLNITAGGTGYGNSDYIVVSNSGATGLITGNATVTTNSTGGLLTTTLTNVGLFGNAVTNAQVLITVLAANGAASNGSTATFTANLTTSTNGGVTPVFGGNAGRIRYETLAELSSIAGQVGLTLPTA
jgi:hypothetical protein